MRNVGVKYGSMDGDRYEMDFGDSDSQISVIKIIILAFPPSMLFQVIKETEREREMYLICKATES